MKLIVCTLAISMAMSAGVAARVAHGEPIVLSREEFPDVIDTLPNVIVEDFQGVTEFGPQQLPFVMANGTANSTEADVSIVQPSVGPRLLVSACTTTLSIDICRTAFTTFTDFPERTVAWGATIQMSTTFEQPFEIIVVGNSGTLRLENYSSIHFSPSPNTIAFQDDSGLLSVSIRSKSPTHVYSLAAITTASVPEPSGMALAMMSSCGALSIIPFIPGRRRKATASCMK